MHNVHTYKSHRWRVCVAALLCLRPAKEGGYSTWASSYTVYNEMLKRRPDLVEVLAQPFYVDRKGEIPEGGLPYFQLPVFNFYKVPSWLQQLP